MGDRVRERRRDEESNRQRLIRQGGSLARKRYRTLIAVHYPREEHFYRERMNRYWASK